MPRWLASSAGLRSRGACAAGSRGALRARWHQQVDNHAQLCCARSTDGASDGHRCALSLCSWVLTWSMTISASSMYLRAREEALLVPHARSSFCTAWSGRRCMRSCARPSGGASGWCAGQLDGTDSTCDNEVDRAGSESARGIPVCSRDSC